jgi:hypothetical protein
MMLVASHNNENECVCDHHDFRGGSLENKVNHFVMGRTHDHLLQVVEGPIAKKLEHVLKVHDYLLQVVESQIAKNRACVKSYQSQPQWE